MKKTKVYSLVALLSTGLSISGYSQQTTSTLTEAEMTESHPSTAGGKSEGKIEKIQVTGSHIKRIDVEGAQPIQVLDREYLDKSGFNSVADVLRETTSNSFGSRRESSGSSVAGVAHVDLKGLGSNRTLVLLNGKRMAKDAISGSVDLNLIPMAAIERVEILKDSASATYGSDALGGVINVITKKDFVGNEFSARQSATDGEGGERRTISLTSGWANSKANVLTVLQYRKNNLVWSRDREWSKEGESTFSPFSNYKTKDNSTGISKSHPGPECPQSKIDTKTNQCLFNYAKFSSELPELEQLNLLSQFNVELGSELSLYGRLNATRKETMWQYAPGTVYLNLEGAHIDNLNLPGHTAGENVILRYRSLELGNRVSEAETVGLGGLVGIKGYLSDTWEWDINVGSEKIKREDVSTQGYALQEELENKIKNGSFNPFAPAGQKGDLSSAAYKPFENTESNVTFGEVSATGDLFDLPGGSVGIAIGGTYSYEKYSDMRDDLSTAGLVTGGGAGSNGYGTRQIYAGYTEIGMPILESLELNLAGRYDHYSDFGSTINPKAGIKFKPHPMILFRASAGTGFKAPDMQDIHAAASSGYPTVKDYKGCAAGVAGACDFAQYETNFAGGKGLQEETSKSLNIGVVLQPAKKFSFGVDFFRIEMEDVVGLSMDGIMKADAAGFDLAQYGIDIVRDSAGALESISTPANLNVAARTVSGLDIASSFSHFFRSIGNFRVQESFSYLLKYENQSFPGLEMEDIRGTNGAPRWKNNLSFSFEPTDRHSIALDINTTGKHQKAEKEQGELNDYTQLSMQYNYFASWNGTFTIGVKNILGKTPPIDNSVANNKFSDSLYDPIGQRAYLGYKQTF